MRDNATDKANRQPSPQEMILPIITGTVIRRIRESEKLTQTELSIIADMNLSYLSNVENGLNNISISKFIDICKALGVAPDGVMARKCLVMSDLDRLAHGLTLAEVQQLIRRYSADTLNIAPLIKAGYTYQDYPIVDFRNIDSFTIH